VGKGKIKFIAIETWILDGVKALDEKEKVYCF